MMLSSIDIQSYLLHHKSFMGCFPCNRLPPFPSQLPKSLIVNSDNIQDSGDHWVGLILTPKKCFYFDSFGVGILENNINKFIERKYKTYIHSIKEIQAIESEKCGEFCMGFVLQVKNVKTYKKFLTQFNHRRLKKNDEKIRHFLRRYLRQL